MSKELIKFRNWLEIELVVFIGSIILNIVFLFIRSWFDSADAIMRAQSDQVDFLDE